MPAQVSVIIPVYNTAAYLGECLDSVLMQSLTDVEIICVDDGSTDDSLSLLKGYAALDKRIKILFQKHAGSAAARNKGLAEANGEFVCFVDSYDFIGTNMLSKMVQQAQTDQSDIVIDGHLVLDQIFKEITQVERLGAKILQNNPCQPEDLSDELFSAFPPQTWGKLIRRSLIHKYHLQFNESVHYMNDYAFIHMLLAVATKISWINDCFTCHRINIHPHQEKNELEEFEDGLKNFALLARQLRTFALDQKYDMPFSFYLKNFIETRLDTLPTHQRGNAIRLMLSHLSEKALHRLVGSSKNKIKISLIVPVYNASAFLSECLDSLVQQTLREIEIICVDDGSTDDSLAILNHYAVRDKRIKILTQQNSGPAIAREMAMQEASGNYVQFVDADDVLELDACEVLYTYVRLFSLDMVSFTANEFHHKTQEKFETPYHSLSWLPERFPALFTWDMVGTSMPQLAVSACLTLYRRMFLLKNNIHWINKKIFFEDTPFFIEAAFNYAQMGALKLPLYHRRIHAGATTQQVATHFKDLLFIYKYTLRLLKKLRIPAPIFQAYVDKFFNAAYFNYSHFEAKDKEKEGLNFYNFCIYMLQKYRVHLPDAISASLIAHTKSQKLKERIIFKFYYLCSKWKRERYVLSLFEWQRSPTFLIKVLSLPLIEIETNNVKYHSMTIKIFGYPVLKVRETAEE